MAGDRVDFTLYLITDRTVLPAGATLYDQVEAALEGGLNGVQLREKDLSAAERLPLAMKLRKLTSRFGAKLLINDRIDLALAVKADGVHLGGHSLPAKVARTLLGPDMLIGVSTHSLDEIAAAEEGGADFVTFGPIFDTPSKRHLGQPTGVKQLQKVATTSSLPLFPLGGIHLDNLSSITGCGIRRAACISAILGSADPAGITQRFLERLS